MSDPTIQEIKEKINIADVIGEYLQLKRAGVNYKALCPFHSEKTPSFMVSPERGVWRCFGCNEGGDVFTFLQMYENMSFPDALKVLADKAGVALPQRQYQPSDKTADKLKEELLAINDLAARFYHESLLRSESGKVARDYLAKRGLSNKTIAQWRLGFAPDDWHQLDSFLVKRGISQNKAIQAGVLTKNESGKVYDRFRFRVMFPLHDLRGRVVGFTGRALEGSSPSTGSGPTAAKYLNSPETPVYNKSKTLFGYHLARNAIRQSGRVVLVEGNMDAIASFQAGVENVIATSGTALTSDQLNILKKLANTIVFAFDTDSAGSTATRRGLEMALSLGFDVRIADLGQAKDPDDMITKDAAAWAEAVKAAQSFLDFSFSKVFDTINSNNSAENLRQGAYKHLELVSLVIDPIIQAQEAQRVAEKLNVPPASIVEYLKTKVKNQKNNFRPNDYQPAAKQTAKKKDRRFLLEERVVALAMMTSELKSIFEKYFDKSLIPADERVPQLEFLGEQEYARMKEEIEAKDRLKAAYEKMCKDLKALNIKQEMSELSAEFARIEKSGDQEKVNALRQKFNNLSSKLSELGG